MLESIITDNNGPHFLREYIFSRYRSINMIVRMRTLNATTTRSIQLVPLEFNYNLGIKYIGAQ